MVFHLGKSQDFLGFRSPLIGFSLGGGPIGNKSDNWWNIHDFDPKIGDIKSIWEASRFDWAVLVAQRAALGDCREIEN